jgi:regulatory protein
MKKQKSLQKPEARDCRERAIGLLARREHSLLELRHKLRSRDCDESDIDELLGQLEQEGLQSDERFAEAYVYSRRQRGFGPMRIQAELRERGVSDQLIGQFVQFGERHWLEEARQQWQKRFGTKAEDYKERARQARFLQGRGFSSDMIRQVLNQDDWD